MWLLALVPFTLQMIAIGFDEIYFHYKRGLPKWERIGHPLDTLSFLLCLLITLWMPFDQTALMVYIGFSLFSCVMITKDEFIHKEHCPGSENWLHAVLFILHPITLAVAGLIWPISQGIETTPWLQQWLNQPQALSLFLTVQTVAISIFFLYQLIFWNFIWNNKPVIKF
jgi:hypothetical protein